MMLGESPYEYALKTSQRISRPNHSARDGDRSQTNQCLRIIYMHFVRVIKFSRRSPEGESLTTDEGRTFTLGGVIDIKALGSSVQFTIRQKLRLLPRMPLSMGFYSSIPIKVPKMTFSVFCWDRSVFYCMVNGFSAYHNVTIVTFAYC